MVLLSVPLVWILLRWYRTLLYLAVCAILLSRSFATKGISKTAHVQKADDVTFQICFYGCLPACVLKQLVNVVQLLSAAEVMAKIDVAEAKESTSKRKK